jgi:hypothetical protein
MILFQKKLKHFIMKKYVLIGLITTLLFSTSRAQQSELHAANTLKGTAEVQTVKDGTGLIPGTPADWPDGGFGKYPEAKAPVDENENGIPDKWEISRGLDLKTTKATGRDLNSNYDNIEVYMNSL